MRARVLLIVLVIVVVAVVAGAGLSGPEPAQSGAEPVKKTLPNDKFQTR